MLILVKQNGLVRNFFSENVGKNLFFQLILQTKNTLNLNYSAGERSR